MQILVPILLVMVLVAKAKTNQFVLIVVKLVTRQTSAIGCMVSHLALSSRIRMQWLIKSQSLSLNN